MLDDSPTFKMIELATVGSTNSFLAAYRPPHPVEITLVTAESQLAGRGQRGNSWESAPAQNLLFSLLLHPHGLAAERVFVLSEAIALSIRDAIAPELGENPVVKWPNDIYVGERKLAGILIENELAGRAVARSVVGCGVNVNQQEFLFPRTAPHSAPVPVSLRQLTGRTAERRFVLERIVDAFRHRYADIQQGRYDAIHADYLAALYRRTGLHPYRDAEGTFRAAIADVEPSGHLCLRDAEGRMRRYAFKEVACEREQPTA